jgi:hypothetical protein
MAILVIVGAATVLGVIAAAIIETRRIYREKPAMPQPPEKPVDKKNSSVQIYSSKKR